MNKIGAGFIGKIIWWIILFFAGYFIGKIW